MLGLYQKYGNLKQQYKSYAYMELIVFLIWSDKKQDIISSWNSSILRCHCKGKKNRNLINVPLAHLQNS